jgi:hypothetical protein
LSGGWHANAVITSNRILKTVDSLGEIRRFGALDWRDGFSKQYYITGFNGYYASRKGALLSGTLDHFKNGHGDIVQERLGAGKFAQFLEDRGHDLFRMTPALFGNDSAKPSGAK